jgi:hypothetical protein
MLGRFPRIVGAAVAILLCVAWFFHGGSQTHLNVLDQSHAPHAPDAAANGQDQTDEPWRHYADIVSTTASEKSYPPAPTGDPVIGRKSPYAYVFYATSDDFACSALVNAKRIIDFHTPHPLYVFLTENVREEYKKEFSNLNVTVIVQQPPAHPNPTVGDGFTRKEKSLLKLNAFRMHQINPSIRRVLFLDANQFVYHSLDTLFELPDVDVAAPRAYWKGNDKIATSLMVISVSDRVWLTVEDAMKNLKLREFDFDLVNNLFGATAMILPGQYAVPDAHWVDWELPQWFRPEGGVNEGGMLKEYSKARLDDLWQAINVNIKSDAQVSPSASEAPPQPSQSAAFVPPGLQKRDEPKEEAKEDDLGEILTPEAVQKEEEAAKAEGYAAVGEPTETKDELEYHGEKISDSTPEQKDKPVSPTETDPDKETEQETQSKEVAQKVKTAAPKPTPSPKPLHPPPWPYKPDDHPLRDILNQLHYKVFVLHFGALMYPWEKHVNGLKEDQPMVHPAMYEQFRHWRESAQKTCPRVKRPRRDPKEGEDEWEWWRPVNDV